jgi:hypothetical protein
MSVLNNALRASYVRQQSTEHRFKRRTKVSFKMKEIRSVRCKILYFVRNFLSSIKKGNRIKIESNATFRVTSSFQSIYGDETFNVSMQIGVEEE